MIERFLGIVELTLCEGHSLGAVVVIVDGLDCGMDSEAESGEGEK